ncbi:MAG: hypothetical protein IKV90_11315 [Clostridia bacterium]|nr:hypothetical protein [Clostridia bacterium]
MESMKRYWKQIGGLSGMIFVLYTVFVFVSHAFVIYSNDNRTLQFVGRAFCTTAVLAAILCPIVFDAVRKVNIPFADCINAKEEKKKLFLTVFLMAFFCFLAAYIVHYPGGFGTDSLVQYGQAVDNAYVDWHPYFHTLFAFKLPLMISGGWTGSIVLLQILLFSAVIAYAVMTVAEYTNKTYAKLVFAFYMLNPSTITFAMLPQKDTSFAIAALFLITCILKMYFSHGEWLNKRTNGVVFAVVLAASTLFRHNAVLFTIPLLGVVFMCAGGKRSIRIAAVFLGMVFLFRIPVYHLLGVENPGNRKGELLGLPMNMIASVAANNPEAMNEETQRFVYEIAEREAWAEVYKYGSYNYIKNDSRFDRSVIEEYEVIDVIGMAVQCVVRSPKEAISGAIRTMDPIYTLTDDYNGVMDIDVNDNAYGIRMSGSRMLQKAFKAYAQIGSMVFAYAFHYAGAMMMVLLGVVLARCNLLNRKDLKKAAYALPMLAYNFGTMLLMTHRGDALRFFYYSFLIVPLYMVIYCRQEE